MVQKIHTKKSGSAQLLCKVSGFTLIEMMIATALFTVLSLIIIGAVLSVNASHKKTLGMASVMNNLSFAMDDMVFNMRTGSDYQCYPSSVFAIAQNPLPSILTGVYWPVSNPPSPSDCLSDSIVAMSSAYSSQSIVYAIGLNQTNPSVGRIYKSDDGGVNFYAITPPEVEIDTAKSRFTVSGSLLGDNRQPVVVIRLSGRIKYKNIDSPFSIESTVSQRQISS